MAETMRLSNTPAFERLLRAFALRLDSSLNEEHLVLSQVRTTLTYRNGRAFAYTLDPANFRVEELDELEGGTSPINGSYQRRRVIFSVRDEAGEWHRPIGTTCILKDIFGLDFTARAMADLEKVVLSTAHLAQQEDRLQRAGDDLGRYADLNGVRPFWMTQTYLNSLDHRDPLRDALHRLLHAREPLDRDALRELRQRDRHTTDADIRATVVPPTTAEGSAQVHRPVPTRPTHQEVSSVVLTFLRPHLEHLLPALPQDVRAEAHTLLSLEIDDAVETQHLCTTELCAALKNVTRSSLQPVEIRQRHELPRNLSDEEIEWADQHWDAVVTSLQLSPLRAHLLAHHMHTRRLTSQERQDLRGTVTRLRAQQAQVKREAERERLQQADADQQARQLVAQRAAEEAAMRLLAPDAQEQWRKLAPLIVPFFPPDSAGLARLQQGDLRAQDEAELQLAFRDCARQYRRHDAAAYLARLEKSGIPEALSAEHRHLFDLAVQYQVFSPALNDAVAQAARQLNLDLETFEPVRLSSSLRGRLLSLWPHLRLYLSEAEVLEDALRREVYTHGKVEVLTGLLSQPMSSTSISKEDRSFLLSHEVCWAQPDREEMRTLRRSLQTRKYTVGTVARLNQLLPQARERAEREEQQAVLRCQQEEARVQALEQERQEQARLREQRQQEQAAAELRERLLAQYRNLYPGKARQLEQVDSAALLAALPEQCRIFRDNGGCLTLDMRDAVFTFLEQAPLPST